MSNVIEVRGLGRSFADFRLEDVSFTLPGGAILGLIGENGAGKTTTIRCILNLMRRDTGEIRVFGEPVRGSAYRADIGVALDECLFHELLTARDVERVLSPVFPRWDSALYADLLERYRLPTDKQIKEFSRGMKMKLSLAAALAHRPRLLILDEVTAGLDPVVRDEILEDFLRFIGDEEHAILLSSHIVSDLEKVADYLVCLHGGRIAFSGEKEEILERYGRVACTEADLAGIRPEEYLRLRRGNYGCELLVADRAAFTEAHPELLAERAGLEELMLLIGKGETPC